MYPAVLLMYFISAAALNPSNTCNTELRYSVFHKSWEISIIKVPDKWGQKNCRYIWNTFSESGINSHAVYCVGCSRKQAACRNNNFQSLHWYRQLRDTMLPVSYAFATNLLRLYVFHSTSLRSRFSWQLELRVSQIQSRHSISSLDTGFELKYSYLGGS
jgi:hypothetical protein